MTVAGRQSPNDPHERRYKALRQHILDDLGPSPRIEVRRRMARFLRELADELDQSLVTQTYPVQPGEGLRWTGADLLIGRALWLAIGSPKRVQIDTEGMLTRIRPTLNGEFYIRTHGRLIPRIACRRMKPDWGIGWRPGRIEGNTIVFDIEATEQ